MSFRKFIVTEAGATEGTDWVWCYEQPKEAAAEVARLREINAELLAALERVSRALGNVKKNEPNIFDDRSMDETAEALMHARAAIAKATKP